MSSRAQPKIPTKSAQDAAGATCPTEADAAADVVAMLTAARLGAHVATFREVSRFAAAHEMFVKSRATNGKSRGSAEPGRVTATI